MKTKKEVLKRKDRFRITHDFGTPYDGVVEPCDWFYIEVCIFNIWSKPKSKDEWHSLKSFMSKEECEKVFNILTN